MFFFSHILYFTGWQVGALQAALTRINRQEPVHQARTFTSRGRRAIVFLIIFLFQFRRRSTCGAFTLLTSNQLHRYFRLCIANAKVGFGLLCGYMFVCKLVSVKWTQAKRGHVYGRTLGTPGTVRVTYLYDFSEQTFVLAQFRSCFVINFIINVLRKCMTYFGRNLR